MARPRELDGLLGADSSGAGVACRAKPVVLRSAGGARTYPYVSRPVDAAAEDGALDGEDVR